MTKVHLDHAHNLHLLKEMIRIRRFEEKCFELYQAQKIRGFLHLYDGEEAVSVGVMQALLPEDAVVATYREHGQAIARGVPMAAIMAEMYGRLDGCCRGRGGSMHIFDRGTRFYGGNAIVGGGLPLAVGLALGDKLQQRPSLAACFFGEGAVDEGEFHESLNLASLWRLPVLFVCENNLYAMGMRLERAEAQPDIHAKAKGYLIPSEVVDGMDVVAVESAARRGAELIRAGNGPTSSNAAPTAFARTPCSMRRLTGRRTRSRPGSGKAPSYASRAGSTKRVCCTRTSRARSRLTLQPRSRPRSHSRRPERWSGSRSSSASY
jgi:pyruvate dehydrogenase E1 component alpha subunit